MAQHFQPLAEERGHLGVKRIIDVKSEEVTATSNSPHLHLHSVERPDQIIGFHGDDYHDSY